MQPRAAVYLVHIEEAAARVMKFTAGKDGSAYAEDVLLRSAVERQLMIIGEAIGALARADAETAAAISEIPRIVSLRNILVHGYAEIRDDLVWDIVTQNVPALRAQVAALIPDE